MARSQSLDALQARCTGFAMEFLRELEGHTLLPVLQDRLMEIDGPLTRSEIERVFVELLRNERSASTSPASPASS